MNIIKKNNITIFKSGIDTLVISLMIEWKHYDLFSFLAEKKIMAQMCSGEFPIELIPDNEIKPWKANIQPNGAMGYEWLIIGHDYVLKVGKWQEQLKRPHVVIEIRSETLWTHGAENAINHICGILEGLGAIILSVKMSRVDLCLDFLMNEKDWHRDLIDYIVSRAKEIKTHTSERKLSGFAIGSGDIQARIYDKALEIRQKSSKTWMFEIWGIKDVPRGSRVIRLEFQMRREFLKEVKVDNPDDLILKIRDLWLYCVDHWLKFQDRPGKHHTQRRNMFWWDEIRKGFQDFHIGAGLVREKAVNMDKNKRYKAAAGNIIAWKSIDMDSKGEEIKEIDFRQCLKDFCNSELSLEIKKEKVKEKIIEKMAKYHRVEKKEDMLYGKLKYKVMEEKEAPF